MNKKLKTIDDVCGNPAGTFKKYIEEQKTRDRLIAEHTIARRNAIRNNLPIPELGFKLELWMCV
jgi:hypothetical protein